MVIPELSSLVVLILSALGIAYLVTGSYAFILIRATAYVILHKIKLDKIFRCFPCCSVWSALFICIIYSVDIRQWLSVILATVIFAAVLEKTVGIAADEKFGDERVKNG